MALLVFNDPEGVHRYELKPGLNSIGRVEGNDQVVPDISVSSRHCEVIQEGRNLVVRDLGSTNGTYVKEVKVQQALISPGEKFRLGNVEVVYMEQVQEPLPPVRVQAPPSSPSPLVPVPPAGSPSLKVGSVRLSSPAPAPPATDEGSNDADASSAAAPVEGACQYHPANKASGTCVRCTKHLCPQCIRKEKVGAKTIDFCLHCGGKCVPYGQPITVQAKARRTFKEMLATSFKYPLKGNGLILLITGTLFFSFLDFITSGRAIMIVVAPVIFLKVMIYGYLFAYMQKIVTSTADGEDEPPGWPDVSDIYQDIFQPCFLFAMTFVVSFLPAIVVMSYAPLAGNLLLLFGIFFYPMGLLAVCMSDSISGLNPLVVISAILKVPKLYTIACIFMAGLVAIQTVIPAILPHVPLLTPLILSAISLYLLTVEMRVLGALYHTNKEKFGWF